MSAAAAPSQTAEPPAASAAPDLTRWRAIKAARGVLDDGTRPVEHLPALVELLGSVDPEARDGLGYEIVVMWVGDESLLDDDGVRELARLLSPRLREGLERGESDATYGRSFAALALSVVLARDARKPTLPDDELFAVADDIGWYAAHEVDLRGHTGEGGWMHATAHTADALKFLARNPRIEGARAVAILDAVAALTVRRHGYLFHYGEDARLAAPVLELLARDAVDAGQFEAWVGTVVAPLLERADAFEPVLYAAQRNARNLLFTLVASIELRETRSASMTQARDVLLRILRGG